MDYIEDLEKILNQCDLTEEEKKAFEDFIDSKVFSEGYPEEEYPKDLKIACQKDSNLKNARQKIVQNYKWAEIIGIAYKYKKQ